MNKILKLFKALSVSKYDKSGNPLIIGRFIYLPEVVNEYNTKLYEIAEIVERELSLTAKQMNSSFHKSWKKIRDADIAHLVFEQIVHYFTTYGFEALGIYDNESVYIPIEKLKIPKLNIDKIELIVIRGITKEEIQEKIYKILISGIALKRETIQDIIDVIDYSKIILGRNDIFLIKNKEVKMILQDRYDIIPDDPVEILRTIIYKLTGESLIIKSRELIEKIKANPRKMNLKLLSNQKKLAEIFLRFKPLFLAMKNKEFSGINKHINKIRKLAKKYHKPMKQDYLNTITSRDSVNLFKLDEELKKVNIFRKVRLVNALRFRKTKSDSIMYRIRNGKSFSRDNNLIKMFAIKEVYKLVKENIKEVVKKKVGNKKIYIPDYIEYTLPSSEKQFSGNFPLGTNIKVDNSMIFGIYWDNVKGHRIDLDLSLIATSAKFGWDSDYRSSSGSILFSGDITDACKGASELFYVRKNEPGNYLLMVNYYNYDEHVPVPFKIFVAKVKDAKLEKNYMVNPNKILATLVTVIKRKQKLLGLIKVNEKESRFYFCETDIGKSITSSEKDYAKHCRQYLSDFYGNLLSLNKIIKDNLVKKDECEIDLSPENLTKDDILNIIT